MNYRYKTQGICAGAITFDLEDGVVRNVRFEGGCNGNTQGVARLVEGLSPEEIAQKLSGIRCGFKRTSCPDQLAKAVLQAAKEVEN